MYKINDKIVTFLPPESIEKEAIQQIENTSSVPFLFLIDELPMAYKDIDEVMENAKELVKIEHTLKQVLNVKGD